MNKFLICPECKKSLSLKIQTTGAGQYFECENNHQFNVEDGVVFFNTREIQGELWSLYLRNYEHYLQEARYSGNSRHLESGITANEAMWQEIEKLHPNTIVDVACGTGSGIKYTLERINWPCTIILTDLSFRILAWNRKYFTEEMRNPYVDLVFLACDCSNIPLSDNSVDMVFSNGGFESMQNKMMPGFKEAYRILKPGGHAIYNKCAVDDHDSKNTKKWIKLLTSVSGTDGFLLKEKMVDVTQWHNECKKVGFLNNKSINIYKEIPAPDTAVFPFENEILQWMAYHVFISEK